MEDAIYFEFLQGKAKKQLSPEMLKKLFIQSVKSGDTVFARKLLESPDFQCALAQSLHNDFELLLYQGRLLSQERNFNGFFELYEEKKNPILKSSKLPEGLLSWDWRMAVNKAISNDFVESHRYFDIHKSNEIKYY